MSSKIIVVSTRPPVAPLSGGMAPAVKRATEQFEDVTWYALGDLDSMTSDFRSAAEASPKKLLRESIVEGIKVKQIIVDGEKWDSHYNKASNSEIWPLFHDLYDRAANLSLFDFYGTLRVNEILAKKIAKDLDDETTPIWIQDYHHLMLAFFLRQEGVKNPIFLHNHIPVPDPKLLKDRSMETQVNVQNMLKGLLSCDAVTFQTAQDSRRFMQHMNVINPIDLGPYQTAKICVPVNHHTEMVEIGHFPISINTKRLMGVAAGEIKDPKAQALAEKMTAKNVLINFERCDYTKGIKPRLLAFELLMERHPELIGKVQIVIGAEPTRPDIEEYRKYAEEVRSIVDRINEKSQWFCKGQPPVVLLSGSIPNDDVMRLLRSTEDQRKIGTVTPHRDGKNLVIKEVYASQDPNHAGVGILSMGAGSYPELALEGKGVVGYNPDEKDANGKSVPPDENIEPIYRAMLEAILMPQEEANARCRNVQAQLLEYDIDLWASQNAQLAQRLSAEKLELQQDAAPVRAQAQPAPAPG